MRLAEKLIATIGVKGFICIASLTVIALALVAYTASVSITPIQQFANGATIDSWTVYVNDINKERYLPGATVLPAFNASNPATYAFKIVTDANQVCAAKIELTSPVNSSRFSKFQITVKYWTGTFWANETLYQSPTGSATKSYIDGLVSGDVGYVHQNLSTTRYYLIMALYSYDLTDEASQVMVTFQYTPLPQNSF